MRILARKVTTNIEKDDNDHNDRAKAMKVDEYVE